MDDLEEPLTPSHLMIGRRVLNLPDHLGYSVDTGVEDFTIEDSHLTRRMKYLNNLLNHYWMRWQSEYLVELRESHRHLLGKSKQTPQIAIGDVAIVHDESLPQSFWKLGCVQKLIVGQDGETRGATVRVINKKGKSALINRPVQLLYLMEIHVTENESSEQRMAGQDDSEPMAQPRSQPRPQRSAAKRGEEQRILWTLAFED